MGVRRRRSQAERMAVKESTWVKRWVRTCVSIGEEVWRRVVWGG